MKTIMSEAEQRGGRGGHSVGTWRKYLEDYWNMMGIDMSTGEEY